MPKMFPAQPDHLFRNDAGRFVDVSAEAGIVDRNGRGLGVVAADVDDDGWVDLFVANDTTANYLWHNKGEMKFEEIGIESGVASNAAGAFQAGMGTALGDLDDDGLPDLFVTNFYGESTTFFKNMGGDAFTDQTNAVGLAGPSRYLLGFGIVLLDANNDGRLDLATTNGHVVDLRPSAPMAMPGLLLTGGGDHGRLVDVTKGGGKRLDHPAHGPRARRGGPGQRRPDRLDRDHTKRSARVFPQPDPWRPLRDAPAGGGPQQPRCGRRGRHRHRWRPAPAVLALGGGSFHSSSDPRIHFGLDGDPIEQVEVRWPSGRVDRLAGVKADRGYRLREGDARPTDLRWIAAH